MIINRNISLAVAILLAVGATSPALAITITATQDPDTLANALVAGAGQGLVVTSATLSGNQQTNLLTNSSETSSGTYTNSSGTYGIGPGIVLTTGAVEERSFTDPETQITEIFSGYGDGPNREPGNSGAYLDPFTFDNQTATAEQEVLLQPLSAFPHLDVTELVINFNVQSGYDRIRFNVAYGTEEYSDFIGSDYIDIFAIFLNGTNIALINGDKFNVDHPAFTTITGTELNGLLAPGGDPLLTLTSLVNPGGNTLRLLIADTQDNILDSTVYLSGLTGVAVVPVPASIWLLGTAVLGLVGKGRVRARRHPPRSPRGFPG